MPRPCANIESFKNELIKWYQDGDSFPTMAKKLRENHDVDVTDRTIKNYFNRWEVLKKRKTNKDTDKLRARIYYYLFYFGINDDEMWTIVQLKKYTISRRGLGNLRSVGNLGAQAEWWKL